MALGPLHVHAHEHLDPVLRLHPTLADGDRDHGVVIRVWVGEEQVELSRAELGRDRGLLLRDLPGQLWIARGELVELVGALELRGQVKGAPSAARSARAALWD